MYVYDYADLLFLCYLNNKETVQPLQILYELQHTIIICIITFFEIANLSEYYNLKQPFNNLK